MKRLKKLLPLVLALTLLAACGGKSGARPLTVQEIDRVNIAFAPFRTEKDENGAVSGSATEVSCFFTSYYDDVRKLGFYEFMRYFPSSETVQSPDDDAELRALAAGPDFPFDWIEDTAGLSAGDLPTPVHRISEQDINDALLKWAGITLEDISDKSGVCRLASSRAYYTFTSDFGPGVFKCAGGEVDGNTARLWSDASGGERDLLTMEQRDGSWYISSFQRLPVEK